MMKTLVFLAVLAFCGAAAAQQYKWVDKDGRVQYGDSPPAGAKASPLKPPPGLAAPPAAAPAAKKDAKALTPEQAFQKRQRDEKEKADKAAKEQAEAQTRRVNCEQAQASLRTLQSGQRVSTTNAAGERVYMEDAQLAGEVQRAQRVASEWCK